MKLDKITADNTKIFNYFNMKISDLTSYKSALTSERKIPMNNLLMISSKGHSSNLLKIFTCITIHQTYVFHDP